MTKFDKFEKCINPKFDGTRDLPNQLCSHATAHGYVICVKFLLFYFIYFICFISLPWK